MKYDRQNFEDGKILSADQLNHIEDGLIAVINHHEDVVVDLDSEILYDGGITAKSVWHKHSGTNCFLIPVSDYTGRTVSLVAGENGQVYSFLIDLNDTTVDTSPVYATGYSGPVIVTSDVEITIPDDAMYLYLYSNSESKLYRPSEVIIRATDENTSKGMIEVRQIQRGLAPNNVVLCTWNIGHFSGGGSSSTINASNYAAKLSAFKELVYETIDPDIVCLQEYSSIFGSNASGAQAAKDVLFNDFAIQVEGPQIRYSCNAIYANACLENITRRDFECNVGASSHTTATQPTDYYYMDADLYIRGRRVKFVSAHLAFNKNLNPDTVCENQIHELIAKYKDYDRVVICGDWNALYFSSFDIFVNAGYTLANTDSNLVTMPNAAINKALDNVIYRGVTVSELTVPTSTLSDHYPMVCKISI